MVLLEERGDKGQHGARPVQPYTQALTTPEAFVWPEPRASFLIWGGGNRTAFGKHPVASVHVKERCGNVHFLLRHVLLTVARMGDIESRGLCCDMASLVCAISCGL